MEQKSIRADGPPMKKLLMSALVSPEMHPHRVGERVTALREALNLSKAEFADSLSLDRSTLSKVEAGTKGLDVVVGARIAEMYAAGMDFTYRGVMADLPQDMRIKVMNYMHAARMARAMAKKTDT